MASLLAVAVLVPLIGAIALLLAPRLDYRRARVAALGVVLVSLALGLVFVAAFRTGDVTRPETLGPQFAFRSGGHDGLPWIDVGRGPGIRFALGLDGISLPLFGLTSLLMVTAVCSSWESVKEGAAAHYALLLALHTGLLGLFASLDVVLFYIFFEFTLIPLFFLIGLYGGPERRRASITFFLYTLAGSLLTLLGVIALVVVHFRYSPDLVVTFSIPELTEGLSQLGWDQWRVGRRLGDGLDGSFWSHPQVLIFLLLFAGFAIKVPLFPFHTWLPLAHVEAPTAGSVLLAGVLLKVGSYGLVRFNLGMTPLGTAALQPLLLAIAVTGILYGALTALAQTDMKRLVAYSSVSHMGFIALGLFSLTATGIDGAVIQMVNHGLTTGALFACVGIVYERYHTREMGRMGGLWNRLPLWAFFLIVASLGSAALPGLNGFVGEFPILLGGFKASPVAGVLAALGMVLGAYYLLWMIQRVVFGPLKEPAADHDHGLVLGSATPAPIAGGSEEAHPPHADGHDPHAHAHAGHVRPVGWHEILGLAPLLVLIVAIGVYPRPWLERIRPSAEQVARRIDRARAATIAPPPVFDPEQERGTLNPGPRDR